MPRTPSAEVEEVGALVEAGDHVDGLDGPRVRLAERHHRLDGRQFLGMRGDRREKVPLDGRDGIEARLAEHEFLELVLGGAHRYERRPDPAPSGRVDRIDVAVDVRVNDPLFGGSGQAADPGMLLTPPDGKRARVSVVSLIGLPEMEQRQSFVNQLQMALFSWIKRNPARDRPPGGLFVMDEVQDLAPSTGTTACTVGTLRAAQLDTRQLHHPALRPA